jgi:hypothetical protein
MKKMTVCYECGLVYGGDRMNQGLVLLKDKMYQFMTQRDKLLEEKRIISERVKDLDSIILEYNDAINLIKEKGETK